MFKLLRHPQAGQYASAMLVCVVGAVVGRQAGLGMDQDQWMAAAASVAGSILVAMLVHGRPAPVREQVRDER